MYVNIHNHFGKEQTFLCSILLVTDSVKSMASELLTLLQLYLEVQWINSYKDHRVGTTFISMSKSMVLKYLLEVFKKAHFVMTEHIFLIVSPWKPPFRLSFTELFQT